jgi:hypothetical protein
MRPPVRRWLVSVLTLPFHCFALQNEKRFDSARVSECCMHASAALAHLVTRRREAMVALLGFFTIHQLEDPDLGAVIIRCLHETWDMRPERLLKLVAKYQLGRRGACCEIHGLGK